MFNTIKINSHVNNEVKFNTTSTGHLQKSHPNSVFKRFDKNSESEKYIFNSKDRKPFLPKESYKSCYNENDKIYITILQILVFGNNSYLIEYIENNK